MLKNSKVVLFLSPYKVGQAGNFWTLLRMFTEKDVAVSSRGFFATFVFKYFGIYVTMTQK